MRVNQVSSLLNTIFEEMTGQTEVVSEDLTNIADVGKNFLDTQDFPFDSYVRKLINRIGYTTYSNREYRSLYGDYLSRKIYDWGSVWQKIRYKIVDPQNNATWSLTNGQTYNQDIFTAPEISQKLFNTENTFEIPLSLPRPQIRESFNGPSEMMNFISNLQANIQKSMAAYEDYISSRTINSMIMNTVQNQANSTDEGAIDDFLVVGNDKCVNLLKLYKDIIDPTSTLTVANCLNNEDFLLFTIQIMAEYMDRFKMLSTQFNCEGWSNQTPRENQRAILLSSYYTAVALRLKSKTFHDNYITLPDALTIPCWQGTGKSFTFDSASRIQGEVNGASFSVPGVLGVLYDEEAVGLFGNYMRDVTTHYNARGDFDNFFYKYKIGSFNDLSENFVIFYINDTTEETINAT